MVSSSFLQNLSLLELQQLQEKIVTLWLQKTYAKGNIILYDGTVVSLIDFKPEDFNPEHCFTVLPKINRYNGNTYIEFSVGQHSLLCREIAKLLFNNPLEEFFCLIHDFQEGLMGDCISPIKHLPILSGFRQIEDNLENKIRESLKLDEFWTSEMIEKVKLVDKLALTIEVHSLNKYYYLSVWGNYIFTMPEVKKIFREHLSEYPESLIDNIIQIEPKRVEVRLRNSFNNLYERISAKRS